MTDALLSPSEMYGRSSGSINTTGDDGLSVAYAPPTHMIEKLGGFLSGPAQGDRVAEGGVQRGIAVTAGLVERLQGQDDFLLGAGVVEAG